MNLNGTEMRDQEPVHVFLRPGLSQEGLTRSPPSLVRAHRSPGLLTRGSWLAVHRGHVRERLTTLGQPDLTSAGTIRRRAGFPGQETRATLLGQPDLTSAGTIRRRAGFPGQETRATLLGQSLSETGREGPARGTDLVHPRHEAVGVVFGLSWHRSGVGPLCPENRGVEEANAPHTIHRPGNARVCARADR